MFLCLDKLRKDGRATIFLRPAFPIPQGEPLTFDASHSRDQSQTPHEHSPIIQRKTQFSLPEKADLRAKSMWI